jgi:hypothetical protein
MEMLTTDALHLKAASITDGVMFDYLEYVCLRIEFQAKQIE